MPSAVRSVQAFALCPGRFRAVLGEPVPTMLCTPSFLDRLSAELPSPVSVPVALLMVPLPEPCFAARLSAFVAVVIVLSFQPLGTLAWYAQRQPRCQAPQAREQGNGQGTDGTQPLAATLRILGVRL